jgi:hypothetical protein
MDCQDCTDADNDGYYTGNGECGIEDCDDSDPTMNPGAQEICDDRKDNDCDGRKDNKDPEGCVTCSPTGTPESVCNGIDDDCDGSIDEDYAPTSTSCGVGECASTGQTTCVGGVEGDTCTPGTPTAEVCDNLDNDCDSVIDDFTRPTSCGVGECGSTGIETCTAGAWGGDTCTPGTPSAEVCDNLDNDCDSVIDDFTRLTNCGVGECAGNTGTETCTAGAWGGDTCDPLAGATPEVCDDVGILDEDCDGQANDNDPECICVPTGPEVCDNIDNDCDGVVDDFTRPTICGVGECAGNTGTETCTAGAWGGDTCDPLAGATTEICDNLDNDCNGATDEDFTNLGTGCTVGVGACENTGTYICMLDGSGTECDASPGTPGVEGPEGDPTCTDNIDNDCDGQSDGTDSDCGYVPPPVRQEIGVQDGLFNNLVEADCRFCHEEDPDVPVEGRCSVSNDVCFADADCPSGETCESTGIQDRHHILAFTPDSIPPSSLIFINPGSPTDPDTDNDGVNDSFYACESCHPDDPAIPDIDFTVTRDCLLCHIQLAGTGSVHHLTPTAQGTDSPIGDPNVGDCTPCHGNLVDDTGDGHIIPTFDPRPETPARSGGTGLPLNSRGNGAGACDYCHDDGISPEGILVETNMDTHHNTGLGPPVEDPLTSNKCAWCHDFTIPFEAQIRICENCHGQDSLHNIQADSDGDGVINPGIELPFYGHIGDPDDCWGCHGFGASSTAPESGPVIPTISSISETVLTEGTDTTVTLSGTAFTNMDQGTELLSDVAIAEDDGPSTSLIPNTISEGSITVTIPGTLSPGNYKLKTTKLNKYSNPMVIIIKPEVIIHDVNCRKNQGQITIDGSGFGKKPEATDDYLHVDVNGQTASIISWTDTKIKVSVSDCSGSLTVTVNAVFGSDTW